MQQTQVRSLGRKDALEKDIAAYSSILAWRIPWIEEPGGLLSMRLQRVEYNLVTEREMKIRKMFLCSKKTRKLS